jgi:hypothetical protein
MMGYRHKLNKEGRGYPRIPLPVMGSMTLMQCYLGRGMTLGAVKG